MSHRDADAGTSCDHDLAIGVHCDGQRVVHVAEVGGLRAVVREGGIERPVRVVAGQREVPVIGAGNMHDVGTSHDHDLAVGLERDGGGVVGAPEVSRCLAVAREGRVQVAGRRLRRGGEVGLFSGQLPGSGQGNHYLDQRDAQPVPAREAEHGFHRSSSHRAARSLWRVA